jgi:hypothetical protein
MFSKAGSAALSVWVSASNICSMVNRLDKRAKFACWCVYFPKQPRVRAWKRTLREVVAAGYAKITFNDVSPCRVELVWPNPVTYDSPARLIRLAYTRDNSFEIVGDPTPIVDDLANVGEAVDSAAGHDLDLGVTTAATVAVVSPQASKRRRIVCKGQASFTTAANTVSETDVETLLVVAQVVSEAVTGSPMRDVALPSDLMPHHLLSLRSEFMCRCLISESVIVNTSSIYEVAWEKSLGDGEFGTVYLGKARGNGTHSVAIKMIMGSDLLSRASHADAVVRRHAALQRHPHIVNLLDVSIFQRMSEPPMIGLIFDHFDTDIKQFLQSRALQIGGMRHVLRSVLAALVYMHDRGLVHADVKPANILLRGTLITGGSPVLGSVSALAKGSASVSRVGLPTENEILNESLELSYHLPVTFEVFSITY